MVDGDDPIINSRCPDWFSAFTEYHGNHSYLIKHTLQINGPILPTYPGLKGVGCYY